MREEKSQRTPYVYKKLWEYYEKSYAPNWAILKKQINSQKLQQLKQEEVENLSKEYPAKKLNQ